MSDAPTAEKVSNQERGRKNIVVAIIVVAALVIAAILISGAVRDANEKKEAAAKREEYISDLGEIRTEMLTVGAKAEKWRTLFVLYGIIQFTKNPTKKQTSIVSSLANIRNQKPIT